MTLTVIGIGDARRALTSKKIGIVAILALLSQGIQNL